MEKLRIAVGTILPPGIGCVVISLWMTVSESGDEWLLLPALILYGLLLAYPIMIIPSFVYSLIMEKFLRKRIENGLIYFGSAAALGWMASLVLSIQGIHADWHVFAMNSFTGLSTGALTALALRHIEVVGPDHESREPVGYTTQD